jgi:competence protein ComEC
MNFWEPRPRQPLVPLALCAALGIFVADRWGVGPWWPLGAFALVAAFLLVRPSTPGCWLLCALAFFSLHTFHIQSEEGRMLSERIVSGQRVVHVTGIVWNEPEKPVVWARNVTARFRLKVESLEMDGIARKANMLLNVSWAGAMPEYGDRVSLVGSVKNLEGPRNPGQFDFASYSRRQGVYCEVRAAYPTDCRIESHGHGIALRAFGYRARRWIRNRLSVGLEDEPEIASVIESIVLGLQSDTPEELKALFQRTGTVHLVAVSGLNVVMLAGIVLLLLRSLRMGRIPAAVTAISILWAYAMVTGFGTSCVRATVMCSLLLLAGVFDRKALSLNGLGAAALFILGYDTNQLFSTGFQFSFVVVLAIILTTNKIKGYLEPWGSPDEFIPRVLWTRWQTATAGVWKIVAGSVAISISAWIGSLLFTAGYFHLISPSALVVNPLAVLLAFFVLALGVASLLWAPVWKAAAVWCNNTNWLFAKGLVALLKLFTLLANSSGGNHGSGPRRWRRDAPARGWPRLVDRLRQQLGLQPYRPALSSLARRELAGRLGPGARFHQASGRRDHTAGRFPAPADRGIGPGRSFARAQTLRGGTRAPRPRQGALRTRGFHSRERFPGFARALSSGGAQAFRGG